MPERIRQTTDDAGEIRKKVTGPVADGCALLDPADVERITGRSPVTEVPSGTDRTSDFQGCFYSDDAQTFLTASFARGLVGTDGQPAAASFGGRRAAAGSTEAVPGIGAGAVFFRGSGGEDGVAVAFDAGGGDLVVVTVEGALSREALVELARQVDRDL